MSKKIIAYDLGTGGVKASLFTVEGKILKNSFISYDTFYPAGNRHEQRPDDWWNGIVSSTKMLLSAREQFKDDIAALAISGHSLGVVPVDSDGGLLREMTPIWSDTRAQQQTKAFFEKADYDEWYQATGNGFPSECYSVFKIMWYRDNEPELYEKTYKILGTKDYCNYKMTGRMVTDHSYASGSGVYDLLGKRYRDDYIKAAGVNAELFADIIKSDDVVGTLTEEASALMGLPKSVKVICGGVDNSCMALGAKGIKDGRIYTSLGSSSWIAAISKKPILNLENRTYVFSHVLEDMFTSATSIFSAGNSLRWAKEKLYVNLENEAQQSGKDAYVLMNELAAQSPIGANKLIFNPSLAGGSMIEESPHIKGGFMGLQLQHTQADVIRSVFEGITLNLRYALDILKKNETVSDDMLIVGGGSKSPFWRQMFADIFGMNMIKTNIDQNAASLGAAALAANGAGLWNGYDIIDEIHESGSVERPIPENYEKYTKLYHAFRKTMHYMAQAGVLLEELDI